MKKLFLKISLRHFLKMSLRHKCFPVNIAKFLRTPSLKEGVCCKSSRLEAFCKKRVFLKISQNSQKNTCVGVSFLIKLRAGLEGHHLQCCFCCRASIFVDAQHHKPATFFLRKRLWHRCFPLNFAKILRSPSLQNTSGRLFLKEVAWGLGFNAFPIF